jgi:hypothetical protein
VKLIAPQTVTINVLVAVGAWPSPLPLRLRPGSRHAARLPTPVSC